MTAMLRRDFLRSSAIAGAGVLATGAGASPARASQQAAATVATSGPIRIFMGGYSPPTTGFSLALKMIGDRVTAKFTARGKHIAEFHGVAGTGKEVTVDGVCIFRIDRGQLVEGWGTLNWT